MGNRKFYKKKLEVISAIDDSQIKKPHHIPVSVYIEEADTLYHRALQDKDELVAAGVAPELIEDLPQRHGALIEAEKKWQKDWRLLISTFPFLTKRIKLPEKWPGSWLQ